MMTLTGDDCLKFHDIPGWENDKLRREEEMKMEKTRRMSLNAGKQR